MYMYSFFNFIFQKYEALLQNYGLDIKNTLNYSSSSNFSIEQALM